MSRIKNYVFRPERLEYMVLPGRLKRNLETFINSALKRNQPLDHVLIHGPPGTGKTTIARIIAAELGVQFTPVSGPALRKPADLLGILLTLQNGDILFIDEIHRLTPPVYEHLAQIMEDFCIGEVIGGSKGRFSSRQITLTFNRFTLIGATTRPALLPKPVLSRFGIVIETDLYPINMLRQIIVTAAEKFGCELEDGAAMIIARAGKGTPRIAIHLLKRVIDFAIVETGKNKLTKEITVNALKKMGIDPENGLHPQDIKYLSVLVNRFRGGPAGVRSIANVLNEDTRTIEDVYEPFLLRYGYIIRTPRGRVATALAYRAVYKYGR